MRSLTIPWRWLFASRRGIRVESALCSERSPLITFPQRRDSTGQPLVQLSVENALKIPASSQGGVAAERPVGEHAHYMTSLPVSFGRLPLSTAEMESINSGGARKSLSET